MLSDIFDLNFNHWIVFLLSAIPATVNITIFIYAFFFLPQNRTNRIFSTFTLLLGIAQLADGFIRISNSEETAMQWSRIFGIVWIFTPVLGLLFTLRFLGRHKKAPYASLSSLILLPTMLFALIITARLDKYIIEKSEQWGWTINPEPTLITTAIGIWTVGVNLLMAFVLWFHVIRVKTNQNKKRQVFILAVCFTLSFFIGFAAETGFPFIFGYDSIPLEISSLTIFSVAAIIAIKKYNMLEYSPRHQWNTIIENMNEGVLIVDNFDKIMYANNKFCQLVDYTFREINGKIASNLFWDTIEQKKLIGNVIEERKEKKYSQYEIPLRTKSGKKIWVIMNSSPYLDKNGKVIGSIGVQTDINRLKELEKTLAYSNARLKEAQTVSHIGNWELNFATNIAIWSEEACRIHGLSIEDKIHSFEGWMKFIHPEDLSFVQKEIQKSKVAISNLSLKYRIAWKDGTIKHIHSLSRFEFNEEGIPIGMYGTWQDVTEQHKAEIALIESKNKIRNFAVHLTNTIENERSYIAREIHDELGQYLTGIKLGLGSFKNLFHGNDKIEKRIEAMVADIESAQQTVRKIVNKIRPGILDTLGLIPSIKWLVNEFESAKKLKYNIEVIGPQYKYKSNISICYFRVCQEALTNILRHADATKVDVKIIQTKNEFVLSICDDGKGISNNKLKNPFSTGLLGMKERANSIGAKLQIVSKENQGTTVQLELNLTNHYEKDPNY